MTLDLQRDEALEVYARAKALKKAISEFQKSAIEQLDEIASHIDSDNGWQEELKFLRWAICDDINGTVKDSLDPLIKEADQAYEASLPAEKPYFPGVL